MRDLAPEMIEISFAWEHLPAIEAGEKWCTIRYAFGADLDPGEEVLITSPEGERLAAARVLEVQRHPAEFLAEIWIHGHGQYRSAKHLVNHLSNYYPTATLSPASKFTVIWFEVIDRRGDADE